MLTQQATDWLNQRLIEPEIAVKLGVQSCKLPGGGEGISIPYLVGADIVNHKYRGIPEKRFHQDKDAVNCFWNYNVLVDSTLENLPLIICEGELDTISAVQSGFIRAVSVPAGGDPVRADKSEDLVLDTTSKKFAYLQHAKSALKDIKEIILAVDGDEVGISLMHDLALRIGKARCKFVTYPYSDATKTKRLKDLNEVLQIYGEKGVKAVIDNAQWIKVDGVYSMSELPPFPEKIPYKTGFECLDPHFKIRMGDFSIVTGIPSHGKTTWVNDLICRLASEHGWMIAIASFEQHPQADHRRNLRQWHSGRVAVMQSEQMIRDADEWIDRHFCFMVPGDDDLANIAWTRDMAALAVTRFGAKMVVLDPWNEIDHDRPSDCSLTEYVGDSIKELKLMARRLDVHLMVVAHPTKMQSVNGQPPMPGLGDISDSAHWYNKSDAGIVIHRPDPSDNRVMCSILKSRYHEQIGKPGTVWLEFDPATRRYNKSYAPTDMQEMPTTKRRR